MSLVAPELSAQQPGQVRKSLLEVLLGLSPQLALMLDVHEQQGYRPLWQRLAAGCRARWLGLLLLFRAVVRGMRQRSAQLLRRLGGRLAELLAQDGLQPRELPFGGIDVSASCQESNQVEVGVLAEWVEGNQSLRELQGTVGLTGGLRLLDQRRRRLGILLGEVFLSGDDPVLVIARQQRPTVELDGLRERLNALSLAVGLVRGPQSCFEVADIGLDDGGVQADGETVRHDGRATRHARRLELTPQRGERDPQAAARG
jgi:hypothetical protein